MTSVLVVDDHPLFRGGMIGLLETVPGLAVVGQAANGAAAVDLAGRLRPDVVLMDLNLPGMPGIEAIRRIRAIVPQTAILVITMVGDDAAIAAAAGAGARGYVLKGAEPEETMRAIQAVADGQAFFGTGVADRLFASTDRSLGTRAALTVREREIAALLAEGLSNSEIARNLQLSLKTVQNHVSQILAKVDARDRTQAVLRLRGLT